jgi:hypothetical protein
MGGVETKVRGDINVELTNLINASTDDQFKKVLKDLEANGVIDPSETSSKYDLISKLSDLADAEKESFRDRIIAGEFA